MALFFGRVPLIWVLITLNVVGGVVPESNYRPRTTGRHWRSRSRSGTPSSASTRNAVASHSRPLYNLYLPFVISEYVIMDADNQTTSEASIEFRPKMFQLKNITRAVLNITPNNYLSPSMKEEWTWTLTGVTYLSISGNSTIPTPISSLIGNGFPANTISFNVSSYLQNLDSLDEMMEFQETQLNGARARAWMHTIRVIFQVRRPCCPQFCQPFLDTAMRLPLLKVDYIADDGSGDGDLELFSGGSRLN